MGHLHPIFDADSTELHQHDFAGLKLKAALSFEGGFFVGNQSIFNQSSKSGSTYSLKRSADKNSDKQRF